MFSIVSTLGVVGKVDKKVIPADTNQQISIIRLNRDNSVFMLNFLKSPRKISQLETLKKKLLQNMALTPNNGTRENPYDAISFL